MSEKITFTWEIHWDCNYRCPYCWYHGQWEHLKHRNTYPDFEKILSVWKRIYDLYGECNLEIVGGEPSIYPNFSRLILELIKYHKITITTNFSGDVDAIIKNNDQKMKEKLRIAATFHPLFSDINVFLPKVISAKENGLNIGVIYLAYPSQIKDIPEYIKLFACKNISFSLLTFWGEYEGKKYPDAYTDEEKKIIGLAISVSNDATFQTEPLVTKGKLCNAGHTYALIHPDGEVNPCGGASREGKGIVMGNIFDPNFKLYDNMMRCPSQNCPCNEWAFLMVRD